MDASLIRARLAAKRLQRQEFARYIGVSPTTAGQILAGTRRLQVDELPKVIEFLGLDRVTVVGLVRHGGLIDAIPIGEQPELQLGMVPPGPMAAIRVAGDGMLPRYDDGDVVLYWEAQRKPLASYLGREAVVEAVGHDRRMLKHLSPIPGQPGGARLQNGFSQHYLDAEITWVGEVVRIIRADQIHPNGEGRLSAVPSLFPRI